jgi:hypothetical protein
VIGPGLGRELAVDSSENLQFFESILRKIPVNKPLVVVNGSYADIESWSKIRFGADVKVFIWYRQKRIYPQNFFKSTRTGINSGNTEKVWETGKKTVGALHITILEPFCGILLFGQLLKIFLLFSVNMSSPEKISKKSKT